MSEATYTPGTPGTPGLLLINKPVDISSFYIIKVLKKILPRKTKIGHTGTLDPFASGLLLVCIGREATRLIPQFNKLPKTYRATGRLGLLTDTLDHTGEIRETPGYNKNLSYQDLKSIIENFPSSYTQQPPIYSACKHEGTPLYTLARQKKLTLELLEKITSAKSKEVKIDQLALEDFDPETGLFTLTSTVSTGTYIRVLLDDIGKKLDTRATTEALTRTAIGNFTLSESCELEIIKNISGLEALSQYIIPVDELIERLII